LRQALASSTDHRLSEVTARLKLGADRLEADLARMALAMNEAQMRVEASAQRAAKASLTASEAAGLAKEGAARMTQKAEDAIESTGLQARTAMFALTNAVTRLAEAASGLDNSALPDRRSYAPLPSPGAQPMLLVTNRASQAGTGDAVLDDLIGDLEALERFAQERKTIASEQAVALTASLVEVIDRLNAVADRVSAAADESAVRAAG
jgi:hypothetical protein